MALAREATRYHAQPLQTRLLPSINLKISYFAVVNCISLILSAVGKQPESVLLRTGLGVGGSTKPYTRHNVYLRQLYFIHYILPPSSKVPERPNWRTTDESPSKLSGYSLPPSMAFPMQKKPLPFLDLPAEIRNQIYREVLISSRKFTVSRHTWFSISNAGLLCASKQIHSEASCFFYKNNIFWFSQHLFHGDPVIEMLQNVYSLPSARLMTLKKLVIDIPVRIAPEHHIKA